MTPAIPIDRYRKPLPWSARILMTALLFEGAAVMLYRAPWDVIGPAVAFLAIPFVVLGVVSLLRFGVTNAALWCIVRAYQGVLELKDRQARTEKALLSEMVSSIERHGEAA